jgi:hypothetical protein
MTKQYMQQHGLASVRGGSYCQVHLDDDTIKFLRREIQRREGAFDAARQDMLSGIVCCEAR